MNKLSMKKLIEASNLPASLIRSTIKQFGSWDCFKERAEDIANLGAAGGFSGFTYHSDTVPFAKRNKKAILASLSDLAQELGEPGAYTVIAGFTCIKEASINVDAVVDAIHDAKHEDHRFVLNALAWFALEELARAVVDYQEIN